MEFGWWIDPIYLITRMTHNVCSRRSFVKSKTALESSHSQLSNAFFLLKNDLMEQKLWSILVNKLLGVKIHTPQNSSKNRPGYYVRPTQSARNALLRKHHITYANFNVLGARRIHPIYVHPTQSARRAVDSWYICASYTERAERAA